MADKVRIGIVGTGGIAGSHVRSYQKLSQVEVVGLCDIIPGKAAAFGVRRGLPEAKCYEDHVEMIRDLKLDGVSICTYNAAHAQPTINCLTAGLHVLCEKPMCVTLADSVRMARAAKASGKILTIGFQPRYDPNMQYLKEIVQSGALGHVYHVVTGSGRRRGMGGGTFIKKETAGAGAIADIGCYALDMAMNTLGYPRPLSVTAVTSNFFGASAKHSHSSWGTEVWKPEDFEVEDFGAAFIRLEGGIALSFTTSWAMNMDSLGPAIFLGTEAGLKVGNSSSGAWDGSIESMTLFSETLGGQTETKLAMRSRNFDLFEAKVRDFVESIQQGRPAPIPGEQIVRNQAIIGGILRSVEAKGEVAIEIPEL